MERFGCDFGSLRSVVDNIRRWSLDVAALLEDKSASELEDASLTLATVIQSWRQSPVIDRLWAKPAGYSGDFQTIEDTCQNKIEWNKFEDVFTFQLFSTAMAAQHRSKVVEQAEYVASVIKTKKRCRVLNIGCGPCFDIDVALQHIANDADPGFSFHLTCIDSDKKALEFSSDRLSCYKFLNLQLIQSNVVNCFRKLRDSAPFDCILCGGLFDYLDDKTIQYVLRLSANCLADHGQFFFSQVSRNNPDRKRMKLFADWSLIERDERDLKRLLASTPEFDRSFFWRDKTQLAICCLLAKS